MDSIPHIIALSLLKPKMQEKRTNSLETLRNLNPEMFSSPIFTNGEWSVV